MSAAGFLSAAIGTALLGVPLVGLAFEPPPNDGYITIADDVPRNVLTMEQEEEIERILLQYEEETSNQIAIVMVASLEGMPIEDAAIELGRSWGVGSAHDNGILLLIAYDEREMFLAVGYGLEGVVPDIVARGILDHDVTPRIREGDYAAGFAAAIDALQKHIGGEYTADRYAIGGQTPPFAWIVLLMFFFVNVVGSYLARTKSWWLGGVLGGVFGLVLTILYGWWISIPAFVLLGLLLDFIVSHAIRPPIRSHALRSGTAWSAGNRRIRSARKGFKGFGGGSFGGGGARGKW